MTVTRICFSFEKWDGKFKEVRKMCFSAICLVTYIKVLIKIQTIIGLSKFVVFEQKDS